MADSFSSYDNFTILNSAFGLSEDAVEHDGVDADKIALIRMIQRVHLNLNEVERLLTTPLVNKKLISIPAKLQWVESVTSGVKSSLEDIERWVNRTKAEKVDSWEMRTNWGFDDHHKLVNQWMELQTAHQALSNVLGYLTPLEIPEAPADTHPLEYDDSRHTSEGIVRLSPLHSHSLHTEPRLSRSMPQSQQLEEFHPSRPESLKRDNLSKLSQSLEYFTLNTSANQASSEIDDESYLSVGIDFGTTYSGVSWALSNKPQDIHTIEWPSASGPRSSGKVPTALTYSDDGKVSSWGYNLDKSEKPMAFFKLGLSEYELQELAERSPDLYEHLQKHLSELRKQPIDVVADYLKVFWLHAMDVIRQTLDQDIWKRIKFKISLGVPTYWDSDARHLLYIAATKAGLVDQDNSDLVLVPEAEAAALAVFDNSTKELEVGDSIIVCDAGGGTAEVIGYIVKNTKPLRLVKRGAPTGGLYGSIFLDFLLVRRIETIMKTGNPEKPPKTYAESELKISDRELDLIKRQFDGEIEDHTLIVEDLRIPQKQKRLLRKSFVEDSISLKKNQMIDVFNEACSGILKLIKDQALLAAAKEEQNFKAVYLVGGFAESPYLYDRVVELARDFENIDVRIPAHNWTTICRGAVLRGLQHGMFTDSSSEAELEWQRALDQQDLSIVMHLTQQGHLIKSISGFDITTPLVQAAMKSHAITEFMCEAGAQVNDLDIGSATPLTAAISRGKNEIVVSLITRGADPNLQPVAASTPLATAARAANKEVVAYLLQHGANPQQIDSRDGSTALITATKYADLATFMVLLDHKADPNTIDNSGRSALSYAAERSDSAKTELLLKHGADPYAYRDKWVLEFSSQRQWPQFSESWKYHNSLELIQRISNANLDNSFKCITWMWELPALLRFDASRGGSNVHQFSLENHVVLIKNRPVHDIANKPSDHILATTFGGLLESRFTKEWSKFIFDLVELVNLAHLESEKAGFSFPVNTKPQGLSITCYRSKISFNYPSHNTDLVSLSELIETIDWVCKILRVPTTGFVQSSAAVQIKKETKSVRNKSKRNGGPSQPHRFPTYPVIELVLSPLPNLENNCWQQSFESFIVAESPIPLHDEFGKGLELSFDMMISLAAAEFQLVINGGLVFVGYQTILIPTEIRKSFAQFHLITSTEGQINPYILDLGKRVITDDPFQFKEMRCFVGWCEVAQINLGTRELTNKVKYSSGRDKGKSLTLDGYGAILQIGASVPLAASMGLQTNFKYTSHRPQFTTSRCYSKLLHDTARDLAIVYDANQRRGWLIPKLSLLLHMSHAYALSCVDVPDNRVPYVGPHSDAGEIVPLLIPLGDT